MPSETQIHGPLLSPGLQTLEDAKIIFELTSWDQQPEDDLFITGPYIADIDGLGNFSVSVFTNENGINQTVYNVYVSFLDKNKAQNLYNPRIKKYIGQTSVSGPGPFCISDLDFVSEHTAGSFDLYSTIQGIATTVQNTRDFVANATEVLSQTYDTVDDLISSGLTYTPGEVESVQANDYVSVINGNFSYKVLAENFVADKVLIVGNGVQLQPRPNTEGNIVARQCGIKTTDADSTTEIQEWCDWAFSDPRNYGFSGENRTYNITDLLFDDKTSVIFKDIKFFSIKTSLIEDVFEGDWVLKVTNAIQTTKNITEDYLVGQQKIKLDSVTNLSVGQLVKIKTTRLIRSDHRGAWKEGMLNRILEIDEVTNEILLDEPLVYSGRANTNVTGVIQSIAADRYSIEVNNLLGSEERDRQCELTITSGTASGESRSIIETTGNFARHMGGNPGQFEKYDRDPWPAGVEVGDAYIWEWSSTVEVYDPIKLDMDNVHFSRTQKNDFAANAVGFHGVSLDYLADSRICDCSTKGFNAFGLRMYASINTRVIRSSNIGCNMEGKGYAISFITCTQCSLESGYSLNCRAGFDATGGGGYCVKSYVNNRAVGGGETHEGNLFFPDGSVGCRATGSHGSGLFTVYDGTRGTNVKTIYNIRGISEKAYNGIGTGPVELVVNMSFGTGFQLDGFNYDDLFTEDANDASTRSQLNNILGKGLKHVLQMDIGGFNTNSIKSVFRNIRAKSVYKSGIFFEGDTENLENLVVSDWDLTITNEGTGETSFEFLQGDGDWRLGYGCSFDNVRATTSAGHTYTASDVLAVPGSGDIGLDSYIFIDDKIYCRIGPNSVLNLPFGDSNAIVNLRNARTGNRPRAIGSMLTDKNATPLETGVTYDIEFLAALQVDGTGVTAGKLGLVLDNDAKVLQLVSNLSQDQTFVVNIT